MANAGAWEFYPDLSLGITGSAPSAALSRASAYLQVPLAQADLDALTALATASHCSDAMWLEAEGLFGMARFADAAAAYSDFIAAHPASAKCCAAQLRIAECEMACGNYSDALILLGRISPRALTPTEDAECNYASGLCRMALGRWTDASESFSAVVSASSAHSPAPIRRLASAAQYYINVLTYNSGSYSAAGSAMMSVDASTEPGRRRDVFVAGAELVNGNNEIAVATARRALSVNGLTDSERAAAEHIAGEALWKTGRTSEAIPHLQRHVQLAAQPAPAVLYMLGVDAYRHNDNTGAVEYLTPAAESASEVAPLASLMLGQALYNLNRRDAAASAFHNAAEASVLNSDLARQAYYNYAVTRFGGASVPFESSSATFEDFLRRYPSGPYTDRVREFLAKGYLADEDYTRALERLDAITAPGSEALAAKRHVLYLLGNREINTGNPTQGLSYLDRAAQLSGDRSLGNEIQLSRARAMELLGQHAAAAEILQRYISSRVSANVPTANYYLGYARFGQERYNDADAAFAAAQYSGAFHGKELADILNRRADIAYYNRAFADAAELYSQSLATDRASGDYAAFNRGRMLSFNRDYASALQAFAYFRNSYPSSALVPDAMLETAAAQVASGHSGAAVSTYTELIENYPRTSQGRQAYIQKAMTLLEGGRREDAIEAYKQVVRRYPSSREAEQASSLLRAILADQNRGAEYVAFMNSVDGMQLTDRAEAATLEFGTARHRLQSSGDTSAMEAFLAAYPDSPEAEEGLAMLAEADYGADRTEQALIRWQSLESRASSATMAMRARMGILRSARDLGDTELAGQTAATILNSSAAPGADLTEATFSRAMYLANDSTTTNQALELWQSVAGRTDELYGAKSAYCAAETLFALGNNDAALEAARALASSRSPHQYWIARAFILQADILSAQGNGREAREYLRALINNYPGSETDIRVMAQERLDALQNPQTSSSDQ